MPFLTRQELGWLDDASGQCRHEHGGACADHLRDVVQTLAQRLATARRYRRRLENRLKAHGLRDA